jgi:hypothetical protein
VFDSDGFIVWFWKINLSSEGFGFQFFWILAWVRHVSGRTSLKFRQFEGAEFWFWWMNQGLSEFEVRPVKFKAVWNSLYLGSIQHYLDLMWMIRRLKNCLIHIKVGKQILNSALVLTVDYKMLSLNKYIAVVVKPQINSYVFFKIQLHVWLLFIHKHYRYNQNIT